MAKQAKPKVFVEEYLEQLKHPLRDVAADLVALLRNAQPGLTEGIKWNAPSFQYEGDDRLTLNLSAKDRVRLILHCGAKAGPARDRPLIDDKSDALEWASNDRAIMTFTSAQDLKAKTKDLKRIIAAWLPASVAR